MAYLHSLKIIHRDIKLSNILIDDKTLTIKLIDFGFAQVMPKRGYLNQKLGSTKYMAPEVLLKNRYDTKVDVWSATVTIYTLVTGKVPFKGENSDQMIELIESNDAGQIFKGLN